MSWQTTAYVTRFLAGAGAFLRADPVANAVLLTEADFWSRLSDPGPSALFGWWSEGTRVLGAFVRMPDHATLCSPLPHSSVAALPPELPEGVSLGVPADDAEAVVAAFGAHGRRLRPTVRLTVLRLGHLRARGLPTGAPRRAGASDLPLLRSWFDLFRERRPEDASRVEYVLDQPLAEGAVLVWEVDGRPVAMASRTPVVAGTVRMGLAFQPSGDGAHAAAAFHAACREASATAEHVLALSGSADTGAELGALGFVPVGARVVLEAVPVR